MKLATYRRPDFQTPEKYHHPGRKTGTAIPQTDNMETLFTWVFNRYWQKCNGSGLN
jgi:hypothetical protein